MPDWGQMQNALLHCSTFSTSKVKRVWWCSFIFNI